MSRRAGVIVTALGVALLARSASATDVPQGPDDTVTWTAAGSPYLIWAASTSRRSPSRPARPFCSPAPASRRTISSPFRSRPWSSTARPRARSSSRQTPTRPHARSGKGSMSTDRPPSPARSSETGVTASCFGRTVDRRPVRAENRRLIAPPPPEDPCRADGAPGGDIRVSCQLHLLVVVTFATGN